MDDLINRQDAIDAIKERDPGCWEDAVYIIEHLPSAERKGKWILHPEVRNVYGGIYIECSECGDKLIVQQLDVEKFCRNCGADMREGGENEID